MRLRLATFGSAMVLAACSTSSSSTASSPDGSGGDCSPAPGACDAPAPAMRPIDTTRGCVGASVTLTDVCSTSVNRCAPSGGIGPVCAFAPDGGAFIAIGSDNDTLHATNWHFLQANGGGWQPPPEQAATAVESDTCNLANCLPACPGTPVFNGFCFRDAGPADASHE